jgi:glycosyltransferase involved in cell wall biosynthesis
LSKKSWKLKTTYKSEIAMRILVVNYEYPPIGGGGGVAARDFAEAWVASGHEVTVVTSRYKGLAARENVNGVSIVRVPVLMRGKVQTASHVSMISYVPSCIFKCLLSKEFHDYNVVNTHFAVPSGPAGQAVASYLKIPNILTIQGGDIFDPSKSLSPHKTPFLSGVVAAMLNRADRVVAASSDTHSNALKYYKVSRNIDIIPLGIKKPLMKGIPGDYPAINDDELVLCTIGRLVKRKNLGELFEILTILKERIKVKLIVIGDGLEKPNLLAMANKLGLQDNVIFSGAVNDETKYQLLERADMYVSTASHEGFGIVFLEAMECGLPVVCYNRGGQNDFLINGKTGYLIPLGDKLAFADKIEELALNSQVRHTMGEFCITHIKNYYIENCADRYIDLFDEVIKERKTYVS